MEGVICWGFVSRRISVDWIGDLKGILKVGWSEVWEIDANFLLLFVWLTVFSKEPKDRQIWDCLDRKKD